MSCSKDANNDSSGFLGDVSSSALDGLDAFVQDLDKRVQARFPFGGC